MNVSFSNCVVLYNYTSCTKYVAFYNLIYYKFPKVLPSFKQHTNITHQLTTDDGFTGFYDFYDFLY